MTHLLGTEGKTRSEVAKLSGIEAARRPVDRSRNPAGSERGTKTL